MSEQEAKKQEPKREPRAAKPLSPEYHKAHKQLMLWAGILFIWELVGIDLTKAENAEGNVGAMVKAIKSPQAIPWVLLVLVGYFLFKINIEWSQCDTARRKTWGPRADFISAWVVSLLAYALYIYQAISQIQFADVLQNSDKVRSVMYGFVTGMMFSMAAFIYLAWYRRNIKGLQKKLVIYISLAMPVTLIILIVLRRLPISWPFLLIGVVGGIIPLTFSMWRVRHHLRGESV